MRNGKQIYEQRNMDCRNKVIKLGNLIQGNVYYDLRHAIYWPKGCAPAMTAAMGMGGGFVPLLVVIDKRHIMIKFPYILSKRRSEQGKQIRRQYKNDIGVPYQMTKQYQLNQSGVCDCITTFTTDNNIIELTNNKPDMEYKPNPTKEDLLEYFGQRIRVRKMTPTEALRLMDVDDSDIEKMRAAGIAKTNLYKLAGNSIVVSCLYHLFRTMFIPGQPENEGETTVKQFTIFGYL